MGLLGVSRVLQDAQMKKGSEALLLAAEKCEKDET